MLTILSIVIAMRTTRRKPEAMEKARRSLRDRSPQVLFTGVLIIASGYAVIDAVLRSYLAMIFPLVVGLVTLGLLFSVAGSQLARREPHTIFFDEERIEPGLQSARHYIAWIAGMLVGAALVGFPIAVTLFIFAFTTLKAGHHLLRNGTLALLTILFFAVMANALVLVYPSGLLQSIVPMPWWLGWSAGTFRLVASGGSDWRACRSGRSVPAVTYPALRSKFLVPLDREFADGCPFFNCLNWSASLIRS
ncbi:MAG: hypothetical protein MJE12_30500 [Alphaproteobacteria bacterium]|nr:hypothetical protein [Alphaproteobacteria bacterium]